MKGRWWGQAVGFAEIEGEVGAGELDVEQLVGYNEKEEREMREDGVEREAEE